MNTSTETTFESTTRNQILIFVVYNGLKNELSVKPTEMVKDLLHQALKLFGNPPNPHTLALWNADGAELTQEQKTLTEAGVKDGDVLLLRPSTVKGG